ncbi:MAG: orotidine-5'-phosphate decarboxylase [Pseudomonadota bacterium]
MFQTPLSRLILALDVPTVPEAEALVDATAGSVGVYKIGLELAMAGGIDLARRLSAEGVPVFLDMKLLDIGNTVAGAVRNAGDLGVRFLTVHAYPQAMQAARDACAPSLNLVAVTVLTSMGDRDLQEAGYGALAADLVNHRLAAAKALGLTFVVCSPLEARAAANLRLSPITPGVRHAEDSAGDQKRVATPQQAVADGAEAIVVGRPIAQAADPKAAAARYVSAIADGLGGRAGG